jgi:Dna[CI] antecedent, DciA
MSWRPRSRSPDRRRDPARVGRALDRVLGELGLDVEKTRRLDQALAAALGQELAPHFELVDLRGRTLELRADSSSWSQELALARSDVLARLRTALAPDDAPTEIRLRLR